MCRTYVIHRVFFLCVAVMLLARPVVEGCRYRDFMNVSHPDTKPIYQNVMVNCRPLHCLEECKDVKKNLQSHSCMTGDIHDYMRYQALDQAQKGSPEFLMMLAALDSCDAELERNECKNTCQTKCPTDTNSAFAITVGPVIYFMFIAFSLFVWLSIYL